MCCASIKLLDGSDSNEHDQVIVQSSCWLAQHLIECCYHIHVHRTRCIVLINQFRLYGSQGLLGFKALALSMSFARSDAVYTSVFLSVGITDMLLNVRCPWVQCIWSEFSTTR